MFNCQVWFTGRHIDPCISPVASPRLFGLHRLQPIVCVKFQRHWQPHKKWNFPRFSPCFFHDSIWFPSFSPHFRQDIRTFFGVFPRFPNRGPSFQVHPAVAAHDQNVLAQHSGGRREARRGQLRARKPALGTPGGSGTSYPAWSTFT